MLVNNNIYLHIIICQDKPNDNDTNVLYTVDTYIYILCKLKLLFWMLLIAINHLTALKIIFYIIYKKMQYK